MMKKLMILSIFFCTFIITIQAMGATPGTKDKTSLPILRELSHQLRLDFPIRPDETNKSVLNRIIFLLNAEVMESQRKLKDNEIETILEIFSVIKARHESEMENSFRSDDFIDFIHKVIQAKMQESFNLKIFYRLFYLISDDSDFFALFYPILEKLTLRESSNHMDQRFFQRVIAYLVSHYEKDRFKLIQRSHISKIESNAIENANWIIRNVVEKDRAKVELNYYLDALSHIFNFYDYYATGNPNINITKFIKMIDRRYAGIEIPLAQHFLSNKKTIFKNLYFYRIEHLHPLITNLFLKIFLENKIPSNQIEILAYINKIKEGGNIEDRVMPIFYSNSDNAKIRHLNSMYHLMLEKTILMWQSKLGMPPAA